MTPDDFCDLEALLNYGELLNSQDKVDEVLQNISDFNAFIYEKSEMLRLREIVTELQTYLVYFRDVAIRSSAGRNIALEEHWLILKGMKNNDISLITLMVHDHLNRSLDFILLEMERRSLD